MTSEEVEAKIMEVITKLEETQAVLLAECPELQAEPDMYVTDFAKTLSGRISSRLTESVKMLVELREGVTDED